MQTATYTVRAHDDLPATRFVVEVAVIGDAPRVTVLKNGAVWCEDVSVPDAFAAVSYLSIAQQKKATLCSKIERAAFASAVAA